MKLLTVADLIKLLLTFDINSPIKTIDWHGKPNYLGDDFYDLYLFRNKDNQLVVGTFEFDDTDQPTYTQIKGGE